MINLIKKLFKTVREVKDTIEPIHWATGKITYSKLGIEESHSRATMIFDTDGYGYYPIVSGLDNRTLIIYRTKDPHDTRTFVRLKDFNFDNRITNYNISISNLTKIWTHKLTVIVHCQISEKEYRAHTLAAHVDIIEGITTVRHGILPIDEQLTNLVVVMDKSGKVHCAWVSKDERYPNSCNIRYAKSDDSGIIDESVTRYKLCTHPNAEASKTYVCEKESFDEETPLYPDLKPEEVLYGK